MPRLAVASRDQIHDIARESHALWGGGLSFADYLGFWDELSATAWARERLTYLVWLGDDGEVLSSLKLYRPQMQVLGEVRRACIIGAVFTPRAERRRGYARALMEAVIREARERGDHPALLFSDIGSRLYGALGFRRLPAEECWGTLPRVPPPAPPGWELHDLEAGDLDEVRQLHDQWCRSRPLVILRDEQHWEFLLVRVNRFFERLGNPRLRPRLRVARHNGTIAGYLISVEGHGEWSIREVGARGGDPRDMANVLAAGVGHARRTGLRRVYGWLSRAVTARLTPWRLRRGQRTRAIPMILPLRDGMDLTTLDSPDAAFLPYQDQF